MTFCNRNGLPRRGYVTPCKDSDLSLRVKRRNPFLKLRDCFVVLLLAMTLSFFPCQAAVEFNGNDDFIAINQGTGSLNDFSVSTWVNLQSINPGAGNRSYILDFRGNGTVVPDSLGLFVDGSNEIKIFTHYSAPSYSQYQYIGPSILNNWVHIVAERVGASFKMFVDGIEVSLSHDEGVMPPLTTPMSLSNQKRIGTYSGAITGDYFFNGHIDDSRIYNRPLSNGEVLALYNSRSKRPSGILANGLIAHYEMDDDAIGEVVAQVKDSSGKMNHGEFLGFSNLSTALSNDIATNLGTGTSLEFDGITENIQADINLSNTNVVTSSFWFKKPNVIGVRPIIELSSNFNSFTDGFVFSVDEVGGPCTGYGMTVSLRGNSGYNLACRSASVPLDEWHHYIGIFDKGELAVNETQLYIDGILQTVDRPVGFSQDNTNNFANDTLYLMSRGGASLFEHGFLDEVHIYNRRLLPSEITYLYNGSGLNPGTSNLQALWAFDDSPVKDSSGNNNHGLGVGGDSLKYTEGILKR